MLDGQTLCCLLVLDAFMTWLGWPSIILFVFEKDRAKEDRDEHAVLAGRLPELDFSMQRRGCFHILSKISLVGEKIHASNEQ